MNKILMVGVARSGTTWAATILSKAKDTFFFNEPDDERRFGTAAHAKRFLTRYPTIAPGDEGKVGETEISEYEKMWTNIWYSTSENVLVKSVFAPFCLEWIKERFVIDHVVWIRRDLRSVIRSWYEYSSQANVVPQEVLIKRLSWQAASHYAAYDRCLSAGVMSFAADHSSLVKDPEQEFTKMASALGLEMGHEAWEQLADLNASGVGGHYGLPDYDEGEHIRRTTEQALAPPDWSEEELDIINKEIMKWI